MWLTPPTSTSETEQAARVLAWLDTWLPALAQQHGYDRAYQRARREVGPPARGLAQAWPHGPRIGGVRLPVSGNSDEAHGHTRLRALVRTVVVPMVKDGQIDQSQARELMERLRGHFADCYRLVEKAIR